MLGTKRELADVPKLTAAQLEPGDLLFAHRPSVWSRLCGFVGDPWHHVGIAAEVDGVMSIVEYGPKGGGVRPIPAVLETSTVVVGRRRCCEPCRRRQVDHAVATVFRGVPFSLLQSATTGAFALVRLALPWRGIVERAAAPLAGPTLLALSRSNARLCTTFVLEADAEGDPACRLRLDVHHPKRLPWADARPEVTTSPTALRRWTWSRSDNATVLALPTDLWRSPDIVERFRLVA